MLWFLITISLRQFFLRYHGGTIRHPESEVVDSGAWPVRSLAGIDNVQESGASS
jgi:hypothetical protein